MSRFKPFKKNNYSSLSFFFLSCRFFYWNKVRWDKPQEAWSRLSMCTHQLTWAANQSHFSHWRATADFTCSIGQKAAIKPLERQIHSAGVSGPLNCIMFCLVYFSAAVVDNIIKNLGCVIITHHLHHNHSLPVWQSYSWIRPRASIYLWHFVSFLFSSVSFFSFCPLCVCWATVSMVFGEVSLSVCVICLERAGSVALMPLYWSLTDISVGRYISRYRPVTYTYCSWHICCQI